MSGDYPPGVTQRSFDREYDAWSEDAELEARLWQADHDAWWESVIDEAEEQKNASVLADFY
jgi:hypothetical protein